MRSLGSSKAGGLVALAALVTLQTTASAMKLASDAELGKVKGMYAPGKTCKTPVVVRFHGRRVVRPEPRRARHVMYM